MTDEKNLINKDAKTEKSKKFRAVIIGESIVLVAMLIVCRAFVFPYLANGGMGHVKMATHTFMIGLTATIFAIFAVAFKRVWKTHKKYILIPVIFTIFGYLMQLLANEVSF